MTVRKASVDSASEIRAFKDNWECEWDEARQRYAFQVQLSRTTRSGSREHDGSGSTGTAPAPAGRTRNTYRLKLVVYDRPAWFFPTIKKINLTLNF